MVGSEVVYNKKFDSLQKIIDFLEEKVIKEENWCFCPSASPNMTFQDKLKKFAEDGLNKNNDTRTMKTVGGHYVYKLEKDGNGLEQLKVTMPVKKTRLLPTRKEQIALIVNLAIEHLKRTGHSISINMCELTLNRTHWIGPEKINYILMAIERLHLIGKKVETGEDEEDTAKSSRAKRKTTKGNKETIRRKDKKPESTQKQQQLPKGELRKDLL
ncbi:unnamed protein product, partial [Didymodactylos carnosus]